MPAITVLVTGATGFIGRVLVRLIHADRCRVRCLVRDERRARALLGPGPELAQGDLRDAESVRRAASGAAAVAHLAALKSDEPDISAVNVQGAAVLVRACREKGISRIVNVSTQATRIRERGAYGRTKAEGDELFRCSGLGVTTLLPSLVYGPDDPGVFGKLARWVAAFPVVPILGGARYRPVHVEDLARLIYACLLTPLPAGREYDVGGPDAVTLEELVDRIAACRKTTRLKAPIPAWAALGAAKVLSAFLYKPPLSVSNVLGAIHSAPDGDFSAVWAETGLHPRALDEGLKDCV